jgi:site-specific recombinase XerD
MGYTLNAPYDAIYESYLAHEKPRVSAQGYTTLSGLARRILHWFDAEDLAPERVTIQDAVRFQAYLSMHETREGHVIATGTMINYLKVARGLCTYLVETGTLETNPFMEMPYPRSGDYVSRNVLSESQMGCLLAHLARFDKAPTPLSRIRRYRVHVIAEFLYASGLRIAEASSLIESNFDLDQRLVYVPEGKGGSARTAFLSGYACEVLKRYFTRGRAVVFGGYSRTRGGTAFGAEKSRVAIVVNEELRAVCTELAIPVITTHGFRHSLGTHLLRAGCDMRHIQAILGHDSLGSTQVYTRVDKDDLRRSLDAHHPRRWKRESNE